MYDPLFLPSFEELKNDRRKYAESFYVQYCNTDPYTGRRLVEPYGAHLYVVQNPPAKPLSRLEMDDIYALPFMRTFHLTSSRGCFGGCNFCALTFHQGRIVQSRSKESLLLEARKMREQEGFKGYIHDVGGPTANFRLPSCEKQRTKGVCPKRQCLFPVPCKNLKADHREYVEILQSLRKLPGVKKVFIRSGIRFDYLLADPDSAFLKELCLHHVSGQLKVAPEHVSDSCSGEDGETKKPGLYGVLPQIPADE